MSQNIDQLRQKILDVSFIIGGSLGIVAYLISLIRLMNNELSITYLLEFLVILTIGLVAIFRKKLTTLFKASVLLLVIFFFSIYDAYFFGVLSAARVYIVLIPFFSFLYFSFSRVIIFHSITIFSFLAIGYMHHKGFQTLPAGYEPDNYILQFYPWVINAIHITIVAFIVLLITRTLLRRYANLLEELEKYKSQLEVLVRHRTEELETTNEELTSTNEELYEQREELQNTLESLRQTQDQLIHSEKMASIGILTAGVAHEINNPVNYIYNGTSAVEEYIKEKLPGHSQNLTPYFSAINEGIDRTVNIVKSLGRYARKDDLPWINYNMHEVLESCLTMLRHQLKEGVVIHRDYTSEQVDLIGNEGQIHQVILNLLVNAAHAINNEGAIYIMTRKVDEQVSVKIKDDGPGIAPDNLKHIFDPFFTTKNPGEGTGLGLSISQKIVTDHGGTIDCQSQLNSGTTFTIYIPVNHKRE